jgi:hypothetical protein
MVQLDEWVQDLPERYLLCRDIGHNWRPLTARITDAHTYTRTMRCTRCHTERHQDLSIYGAILSSGYTYPDGYLAPPNSGRMTSDRRDGLRLESVQRLIGA